MNKFIITWISLVILITLSACAPTQYIKQGATQSDWQRDWDLCQQRGWSAGTGNPLVANSIAKRCIEEHGWTGK